MSLLSLEKSAPDDVLFRNITKCLRETAESHHTDTISVLKTLDRYGNYQGIRKWYASLAVRNYHPKIPKFSGTQKSAEALVRNMPLLVTGARPGEIILGTMTQSKDAVIKIHREIVPPKTQDLDTIRGYEDLWRRFLAKIGSIEYFSELSMLERELWLEENEDEFDLYIDDVDGIEFEVLQISGDFLNLSEEDLESLGSADAVFPAKEITAMFPKKPGSEGLLGRHTLIFRRGIWNVSVVYKEVRKFDGPVVDVGTGEMFEEVEAGKKETLLLFDTFAKKYIKKRGFVPEKKQTIGFLYPRDPVRLVPEVVWGIILKGDPHTIKDIEKFKHATRNFTAASFKSLLQKTIRFRAKKVSLADDGIYPSGFVLKACFGSLLLNPGSFVPDIQRFVSGLESALKRLVVTLFEDAYIPEDSENITLSTVSGAFLAQRVSGWRPSKFLLTNAMKIGVEGLESPKAFVFDISAGSKIVPYVLSGLSTPLEATSGIMEELRSFAGDLAMIRVEVANREKDKITELKPRPKIMPIEHCVDQHWAPEVVYMYPTSVVYPLKTSGSKPFSEILIKLFSEVTGVNPRRPLRKGRTMQPIGWVEDFEEKKFTKETREAQRLTLLSKQLSLGEMKDFEVLNGQKALKYSLDKGWIAGMLGAVEVKGRPPALVTLHPEDPEIFVAVRKPSRGMKDAFLTDEREAAVIKEVKKRLRQGISLKQAHPPVPDMKGSKLVYRSGVFYIVTSDGRKVEWDIFRKSLIRLQLVEDVPLTIENTLIYTGEGIVKDADDKLRELLGVTPDGDIRRAMMYVSAYSSEFEFARIGRDGGGTKQTVSIDDVGAWQLTMKISLLYPSALRRVPGNALKFKVPIGPLLWHIRDIMVDHLSAPKKHADRQRRRWGKIGERLQRSMWEHQTTSLDEMRSAHNAGRKGHFIWIPVGLGKTLIVLSYLKWLEKKSQLPRYIIYTLPSSAIKSIQTEIEGFGFRYRLLVPLKTLGKEYESYAKKGCEPEEYTINLIEHDHLRRCEDILPSYMSESVFVIDEVHKCLNDTKRTAVALQLSHLSQEFIALTGTPIIDSNTYKLIWWLEQIVPFEVNESNFWVAANGMVAKKVNTGVKVKRDDLFETLNESEERRYQSLVPAGLGGKNSHPRPEDLRKAMEVCYEAANRGIIEKVAENLEKKRGVFVIAKDKAHQESLRDMILQKTNLSSKDIFLISKNQSLFLTDEAVEQRKSPDYKVVITTIRHSEGYTLTRLSVMITSVYPSNNATREQLEGRINRIGQRSGTIWYYIIHTGILTYILQRHNDARNLSAVLSAIADEISFQ